MSCILIINGHRSLEALIDLHTNHRLSLFLSVPRSNVLLAVVVVVVVIVVHHQMMTHKQFRRSIKLILNRTQLVVVLVIFKRTKEASSDLDHLPIDYHSEVCRRYQIMSPYKKTDTLTHTCCSCSSQISSSIDIKITGGVNETSFLHHHRLAIGC